ncbi:MAG: hypothetical protein KDB17_09080 [Ilumatobacter sp.]|nr:hypothetical protein [Ilumatobacter sp.]
MLFGWASSASLRATWVRFSATNTTRYRAIRAATRRRMRAFIGCLPG